MFYFSANSCTSTVSLPPVHPDDERGADAGFPILHHSDHDTGNNNDTPSSASTELNDLKAANAYSNAVMIGNESNSTEDSDGETSIVICEQVIQKKTIEDKSNGIPLLGDICIVKIMSATT